MNLAESWCLLKASESSVRADAASYMAALRPTRRILSASRLNQFRMADVSLSGLQAELSAEVWKLAQTYGYKREPT